MMNVVARRVSLASKVWYVKGLGITGSRSDIKRWAALCGHRVTFVIPRFDALADEVSS